MSRIFLSHSSNDEREAVALKHWLTENGWNDVFLDVDPQRGLAAGERWQEALRKAADRCEVVLFVVSPAWAKSKWCLAEFLLAKSLHKLIFGLVLKDVPIGELPAEMTSEWQLCRLVGEGSSETIRFPYREITDAIAFLAEGLGRLREGLRKAGLNADYFPWPPQDDPQRAPYRGLEPLEATDAAVFFGRDVEILRGLDAMRGMRDGGDKHLFIILGASGAGKSSFLRAGLLPRLARDDRHFFPLAPLRPEREPIFGERGLAHALHRAWQALKLPATHLGDIKSRLREGPAGLAALLRQLQEAAHGRTLGTPEATLPPTLVLSVDQAEELFNADAGDEARSFLQLLGGVLGEVGDSAAGGVFRAPLIVAFTIRSDRYEPLQTAPNLAGLQSVVFDDLKPMPPTRFCEVILGPAKRTSDEGRKLIVQPELVDQLVKECHEGADTLPLLGLTLARLYREYGGDGDLRLDEYQTMGGLANIVKTEAESVLSTNEAIRQQQLELLHAAFIPWLATINPQNDQPMRRLARRTDLEDAHALIAALAEKRLLLIDQRDGVAVVEVAHEALLRQWDVLAEWLTTEREELKDADVLERAAQAWAKSGRKDAWLMEGERLTIAETLAAKPGFSKKLDSCREFLLASRRRDEAKRAEEEKRWRAELKAAQRSKLVTSVVIGTVLSTVGIGTWAWYSELVKTQTEKVRTEVEKTRRIGAEGIAALKRGELSLGWHLVAEAAALVPRDGAPPAEVELALDELRSHPRPPVILRGHVAPITKVILSPDGRRALTASEDGSARLWDTETGRNVTTLRGHHGVVSALAFSHDGTLIATASDDTKVRLWDARSGQERLPVLGAHEDSITVVAFCGTCTRLLTASRDGKAIIWDSASGKLIRELPQHEGPVLVSALSPDGNYALTASDTHRTLLWKVDSEAPPKVLDHPDSIALGTFTTDGKHVVTATNRGAVRVWDISGKEIYGWVEKDEATPYYTDGERIVMQRFGADHRRVILAEVATGRHIIELNTDTRIVAAALSADGKTLVTAEEDQVGRIWDTVSGRELTVLRGHWKLVRSVSINANPTSTFSTPTPQSRRAFFSVAISADGKHVITGLDDQTALLWETSAFQTAVTMKAYASPNAVAFSPDSRHLLSAFDDQTARVWDIDGQKFAVLRGHDGAVTSVAIGPTGESIVTGSLDGTARLWNLAGKELVSLKGHDGALRSVAFSPDKKWILSASDDGTARLWESATGQPAAVMRGHRGAIRRAIFATDGRRVATIAADETARLWNLDGKEIAVLKGHDDALLSIAFSADSKLLATGSRDTTIRLWDAGNGRLVHIVKGHRDSVAAVAFSPDGKWLASGGGDRDVRIWDVEEGKERKVLKGHDDAINTLIFSPDGTSLASASDDKTAREWDVATWHQKGKFVGHTNWIGALAYSPDGSRIATASADHTVRIWSARHSLRDQADYARAISPDLADPALVERLGLKPEPSFERTIPQRATASACDQLAAHPFDSTRVASGVIWSRLSANPQAAIAACRQAVASEPGNARLQYQFGRALENFSDPAARAELEKAAEAGYARAQGALGSLLIDTKKNDDFRGGVQWLKRAVSAGDTVAQFTLADLLLDGKRLPQDQLEAKRLFTLAATMGHPDSHGKLAEMAEKGEPLPGAGPNYAAAYFHHALAARCARAVFDDATAQTESERRAAIARKLPDATVIALWRKAAQWKRGQTLDLQP